MLQGGPLRPRPILLQAGTLLARLTESFPLLLVSEPDLSSPWCIHPGGVHRHILVLGLPRMLLRHGLVMMTRLERDFQCIFLRHLLAQCLCLVVMTPSKRGTQLIRIRPVVRFLHGRLRPRSHMTLIRRHIASFRNLLPAPAAAALAYMMAEIAERVGITILVLTTAIRFGNGARQIDAQLHKGDAETVDNLKCWCQHVTQSSSLTGQRTIEQITMNQMTTMNTSDKCAASARWMPSTVISSKNDRPR